MHCSSSQPPKFYYVGIETSLFTLPFWLASEILIFFTHLCPYCYHLFIVYLSHCLWINPVEPSVLNHHIAKISLRVIEKGQEYRYFSVLDKVNDLMYAFAYYIRDRYHLHLQVQRCTQHEAFHPPSQPPHH